MMQNSSYLLKLLLRRGMKELNWISNVLYTFKNHSHQSDTEMYKKIKSLIYFMVMWNEETLRKNA